MARTGRQVTDAVAYLLIPGICVVLPGAASRGLLRRASGWKWFLAADAALACAHARRHLPVNDEAAWRRRWKQVELFDVRDLYLMLFRRSATVLNEIEMTTDLENARNRVLVGMHWGPAISILKLLAVSNMNPAFPFRRAEKALRRSRPFFKQRWMLFP